MTKICSKCKIEKPRSSFRTRKDRPCGLRSQCRNCDNQYRKSTAGQTAEKRYRASTKGKLTHLLKIKRYQRTTQGKIIRNRYRISDKGKASSVACHTRRRKNARDLDQSFTQTDALAVYRRFDYQCFRCGSTEDLQIDHHYPLSKGYGLSFSNAVLLCQSCNCTKHSKMPEDFYTQEQLKKLESILS